jgi:hypothetical protein
MRERERERERENDRERERNMMKNTLDYQEFFNLYPLKCMIEKIWIFFRPFNFADLNKDRTKFVHHIARKRLSLFRTERERERVCVK